MKMSPEINEIAKALSEFQKAKKPARFDSEAMATKTRSYKYASLGSVDEVANEMTKFGLSYSMFPISDGWYIGVDVILMHTSGQWLSESFMFPMSSEAYNPAQEAGKIITYARRYALASMLGITADEDIDAGSGQPKKKEPVTENEVDGLIKTYWNPLTKLADKVGIEYDPLPPNPTLDEVKEAYMKLQDEIEGAK